MFSVVKIGCYWHKPWKHVICDTSHGAWMSIAWRLKKKNKINKNRCHLLAMRLEWTSTSVFFLKRQPGRSSLASLPTGYLESQNTTQPQQKALRVRRLRFLKATWTIDRATAGWAPEFPLLYEEILPSSAGASGWMSLSSPLRPLSHSLINFIPFLILFV